MARQCYPSPKEKKSDMERMKERNQTRIKISEGVVKIIFQKSTIMKVEENVSTKARKNWHTQNEFNIKQKKPMRKAKVQASMDPLHKIQDIGYTITQTKSPVKRLTSIEQVQQCTNFSTEGPQKPSLEKRRKSSQKMPYLISCSLNSERNTFGLDSHVKEDTNEDLATINIQFLGLELCYDCLSRKENGLLICSVCNKAAYCNQICQLNNWSFHRNFCRKYKNKLQKSFHKAEKIMLKHLNNAINQSQNGKSLKNGESINIKVDTQIQQKSDDKKTFENPNPEPTIVKKMKKYSKNNKDGNEVNEKQNFNQYLCSDDDGVKIVYYPPPTAFKTKVSKPKVKSESNKTGIHDNKDKICANNLSSSDVKGNKYNNEKIFTGCDQNENSSENRYENVEGLTCIRCGEKTNIPAFMEDSSSFKCDYCFLNFEHGCDINTDCQRCREIAVWVQARWVVLEKYNNGDFSPLNISASSGYLCSMFSDPNDDEI